MHIDAVVIKKWFDNYDKWINQALRAERMGIAWTQKDDILGITYKSVQELDSKAEEMRLLSNDLLARWKKSKGLEVK